MVQNTSTSKSSKLNLYRKLKDISAVRFHEIKFTSNILLIDKDYEEDKVYSPADVITINESWLILYDEYFEKTDNTKFKKDLKDKKLSLSLLIEINLLKGILNALESIIENEAFVPNEILLNTVSSIGNSVKKLNKSIKFNATDPLKTNIENVRNYLNGLQTRYEIIFKKELVVEPKDITLYYEMTIQIARVLKMDYIPDHINMLQYIAYEKTYRKELSNAKQHRRKQRGKGTN